MVYGHFNLLSTVKSKKVKRRVHEKPLFHWRLQKAAPHKYSDRRCRLKYKIKRLAIAKKALLMNIPREDVHLNARGRLAYQVFGLSQGEVTKR